MHIRQVYTNVLICLFVSIVPSHRNVLLTAAAVFLFLMAVVLVMFGLIIR